MMELPSSRMMDVVGFGGTSDEEGARLVSVEGDGRGLDAEDGSKVVASLGSSCTRERWSRRRMDEDSDLFELEAGSDTLLVEA